MVFWWTSVAGAISREGKNAFLISLMAGRKCSLGASAKGFLILFIRSPPLLRLRHFWVLQIRATVPCPEVELSFEYLSVAETRFFTKGFQVLGDRMVRKLDRCVLDGPFRLRTNRVHENPGSVLRVANDGYKRRAGTGTTRIHVLCTVVTDREMLKSRLQRAAW